MFGLGMGELLVVGGLLFLLFGAKKLPELGGSLAKGIKNFQQGLKDDPKKLEDKKEENSSDDSKQD